MNPTDADTEAGRGEGQRAIDVTCPICDAEPGIPCKPWGGLHVGRDRKARGEEDPGDGLDWSSEDGERIAGELAVMAVEGPAVARGDTELLREAARRLRQSAPGGEHRIEAYVNRGALRTLHAEPIDVWPQSWDDDPPAKGGPYERCWLVFPAAPTDEAPEGLAKALDIVESILWPGREQPVEDWYTGDFRDRLAEAVNRVSRQNCEVGFTLNERVQIVVRRPGQPVEEGEKPSELSVLSDDALAQFAEYALKRWDKIPEDVNREMARRLRERRGERGFESGLEYATRTQEES